jgi:hypothetical protein
VKDEMSQACSTHGSNEMYTEFWSGNLKGRDHMEDLGVDGRIIIEWVLKKLGGNVWIKFI